MAHLHLFEQLKEIGKYTDLIHEGAERYDVRPSVICGIGSRESGWGLLLKPIGPGGTGDATPRPTAKPWRQDPLPPDGRGFGRGLMQIDYDAHEFARSGNWMDPRENIMYGCGLLDANRALLAVKTSLTGPDLLRAAIAAYNCGAGNVIRALKQKRDVDYFTSGRDYSKDVLERAGWFQHQGWP